mgnify:CR=1 FL=1
MGALASYLYSISIMVKIWRIRKLYVALIKRFWGKLHILGLRIVFIIEIIVFNNRTFLELLTKIRQCISTFLTRFSHWIENFIVERRSVNFLTNTMILWKFYWSTQVLEIMMLNFWFIIIIKFNWFLNNRNFFFNFNSAYSWSNF